MHAPLGVGDRNVPEETVYDPEAYYATQWFTTPWSDEIHGWILPISAGFRLWKPSCAPIAGVAMRDTERDINRIFARLLAEDPDDKS